MADRPLQEQQQLVRIPLYDTNKQRISEPSWAIPTQFDQSYINCFPVFRKNNMTGDKEAFIQMRPGFFSYDESTTSSPTAITNNPTATLDAITITQLSDRYVVAFWSQTDNAIYIVSRNATGTSVVLIGTISTSNDYPIVHLSEITIAGQAGIFITFIEGNTDSTYGYYAVATSGAFTAASLTLVSDLGFPPNQTPPLPITGPAVQLNNKIYVLTRVGSIHNSDSSSASVWNALNAKNAISYPDQGIALARYKHHLVCFGSDSIEFFNDVGNATGSPLDRTDQAFIKFGLKGSKAFINIHDTIYWISNSTSAMAQMYRLEGYTPEKVDSGQYSYVFGRNTSWMSSMTFLGKTHIHVCSAAQPYTPSGEVLATSGYAATSLMYNIDDNEFWYYSHTMDSGNQFLYPSYVAPMLCVQSSSDSSNTDVQYLIMNLFDVTAGTRYCWAFHKSSSTDQMQAPDSEYTDTTGSIRNESLIAQINLNPIEFGNYNRKFLRKVNVVTDPILEGSVTVTLNKESWIASPQTTITKTQTIPNTGIGVLRSSFNNFGQARRFLFTIGIVSHQRPTIVRAFEAMVAQGTH